MQDIKELKNILEQKSMVASNIVIVPHKEPDFDAIGSSLGLSLIADKFKKPSCIVIDDPITKMDFSVQTIINETIKKGFNIINREKYLQSANENELVILTDVNKSNLIYLNKDITPRKDVIIIDHHDIDKNTLPARYQFIDRGVSSACEIITKLLCMFKIKYDADIANYLLAGIYLDTNKLTKNTSAETFRIVTKLLENKASIDYVLELFSEDFISDRKVQNLISNADFFNFTIATVVGNRETEYTKEELAKAADYLLKYKVDASFAIGMLEEDIVSISARSKGKIDVGQIMSMLDGGGNLSSAATKLTNCTPEDAAKKLAKVIKPIFYQNND